MDRDTAIEKLARVHGDKYDYSLLPQKVTTNMRIDVICSTHGIFSPNYHDHLYHKSNCPSCRTQKRSFSTKEFVEKAKKIHGNKYDYSKVQYVNNYTKVIIICKEHGEFNQTPYSHVNYRNGCKRCGNEKQSSGNQKFVEKAKKIHGNKYDYSKVQYVNLRTPVDIVCPTHGVFLSLPTNHIHGNKSGCPECASHVKYTKSYLNKHPNIIGMIYLIELSNDTEKFIKIGITKHSDVSTRYKQYPAADYNITIINTKIGSLLDMYNIEQQVLSEYKSYQYTPKHQFSGMTECFVYDSKIVSGINEQLRS